MTTEDLHSLLRGFAHRNEAALERLAHFPDWQRVAAAELERRATSVVQSFDDETLQAIAAGTLDLPSVCRAVAGELEAKAA